MTIYLDIVFTENIIMNYIILFATGIICKEKIKQMRIIISSIIGSIYSVAYYVTEIKLYVTILAKILLSIVMIYVAFNAKSPKRMFRTLMIFYLTSFAFGGCAFAVLYYLESENILYGKGNLIYTYPFKIAIAGGIIGFFIINIAFKLVKKRLNIDDMFCNIKIWNDGKEKKVKAMIDTGNLMKDPITNSPVIIIEKNSLKDILPEKILDNTQKIINGQYEFSDEDFQFMSKFRVLPFSSLGKQNGMLLGFKVNKVQVEVNDEEIVRNDVIVGIYDKTLSQKKEYSCLMGLNFLEEV